jgi:hypothetical protein
MLQAHSDRPLLTVHAYGGFEDDNPLDTALLGKGRIERATLLVFADGLTSPPTRTTSSFNFMCGREHTLTAD